MSYGEAAVRKDPEIVRITSELSGAIHTLTEILAPFTVSIAVPSTKAPPRQLSPALGELQTQVDRLQELVATIIV